MGGDVLCCALLVQVHVASEDVAMQLWGAGEDEGGSYEELAHACHAGPDSVEALHHLHERVRQRRHVQRYFVEHNCVTGVEEVHG